ncbi:hypothetical protein MHYP_G00029490 [Metynnis hypsauchen]
MMRAYLSAVGIRVPQRRVRDTLNRIDPAAAAQSWGIVTHGGIDRYSWVITYLTTSTDNTAQTVLAHFVGGTCRYGLPSRVRSDHGGKNTLVALLMNLLNGEG